MNKNKILFSILGAIIFGVIIFLVINLNNSTTPTSNTTSVTGDINIWVYGHDASIFQEYLGEFKEDIGKYNNTSIVVENFSDYEIYENTLSSAFILGTGPDIFVINNNMSSFLENQTLGIDPSFISPNDFRKAYKGVFADDLITTLEDDPSVEFLKGIPMGYETLGIFFNRRYFKSDMFNTWTSLNSSLSEITEKNTSIIPVGLGNENVALASEILMHIFASLGGENITDLDGNTLRQGIQTYLSFGDRRGGNRYNSLSSSGDALTNIDYFSRGDVVAIAGYPRTLQDIKRKGYQNNFLLAHSFPQFASGEQKSLVNYNYFVTNKDSQRQDFVNDLFGYMVSQDGIESYFELFPYYLPSSLELEEAILERKIDPDFNIVYKDFINRNTTQVSFNVGNRAMFENAIPYILSVEENNDTLFESLKSTIICATNKSLNFTNLSSSCK